MIVKSHSSKLYEAGKGIMNKINFFTMLFFLYFFQTYKVNCAKENLRRRSSKAYRRKKRGDQATDVSKEEPFYTSSKEFFLAISDFLKQTPERLPFDYVDFDYSMKAGAMIDKCDRYTRFLNRYGKKMHQLILDLDMTNLEIRHFFRELFEKNNLSSERKKNSSSGVPKVIHQIWLGGQLPKKYKMLQETWRHNHPDWEYRLWTDKDIEDFDLYNKELFDKGINFGEKANILRYEILYRFGGLYVDTDFECLKPFDVLNENYEFYCGLGPCSGALYINNALIASVPGHPILEYCIKNMKKNLFLWKDKLNSIPKGLRNSVRCGPSYFTKSFLKILKKHEGTAIYDNVIAFPTTYFYPISVQHCQRGIKLEELIKQLSDHIESFGVHYWEGTWLR